MLRRILLLREIILPKARLARSLILWGKFSLPILFLAGFFIFGSAAKATVRDFILSGGSEPTDNFCVDDDIYVYLDNNLIYSDIDLNWSSCNNQPINFQADAGAALRIVAIDSVGICRSLGPLWLHYENQSVELDGGNNDGCVWGPAGMIFYDKTFVISQLAEPEPNPVILVPGIMGSYLYSSIDPGVEVWPAVGKTVIDPWDLHLNQLIMDEEGKPSNNSMIVPPQDIIRSVLDKDFFAGLIEELKQNGYVEGENLFVFPYDWRLDLNWSANGIPYSGFDSLKDKVEKVKSLTGAEKVNIIAHSMGGLVAKYYIKHYGSGSVNKFIDIGTPHLGAPEALKILMYGDDLGFKFNGYSLLNLDRVKIISQNFPSVYQILPSQNYFDNTNPDYAYYIYDMHDLDNNDISGKLNYNQSIDFIKNTGRNNYLLGYNNALHSDLDNYSPLTDGIKTYNIIGCGSPTIGQIFVLNQEKSGGYEYGLKYISGDGTVPLRSAEALISDSSYYVRGAGHSTLPSANGIKQIATAILEDTISSFSLQNYPEISRNSADCSLTGTQISFHSPVELNVYDENNNHVGPDENGDIELGIAGAQYDDLDGNKFVFLPAGHNYRVEGLATASGTFNARIQNVENGQYTKTTYFNEVPLESDNAVARMQVNNGQLAGVMEIDKNGDQIFETEILPSAILNQEEAADLIKPETQINISGMVGNNGYYISTTTATLTATDNQGGSGILKTEYSLDNGQNWQNYENPIILSVDGEYNIIYKSTDKAGNIEEEKTAEFKIDSIPPIIDMITPLANDEYDHAENLEILYNSIDSTSGIDDSAAIIKIDGQDVSILNIDLFLYKLGNHELTIKLFDLAGNQTVIIIPFSVVTSISGTINDIERLYLEKQIIKVSAKNELINKLNSLQKYIKQFGKRQDRKLFKYQERLAKCDQRKNYAADCRRLIKKLYERHEYVLNKVRTKIVANRFANLLKDLEKYYTKKWLTPKAYEVIKENLIYLKNNL